MQESIFKPCRKIIPGALGVVQKLLIGECVKDIDKLCEFTQYRTVMHPKTHLYGRYGVARFAGVFYRTFFLFYIFLYYKT